MDDDPDDHTLGTLRVNKVVDFYKGTDLPNFKNFVEYNKWGDSFLTVGIVLHKIACICSCTITKSGITEPEVDRIFVKWELAQIHATF
jgi:hypothetical protein